jgi:bla regulator protein BlaR1
MNKVITAFSWMLIHSLWQGLLLAVIAGFGLMFAKKSGATRRYNMVLILFVAFIGICAYTFMAEWVSVPAEVVVPSSAGNPEVVTSSVFLSALYNIKQLFKIFGDYFSANAPLVVLIWLVFFLFKSVKMMACLMYNHRVKNTQVYEADPFWANAVNRFSEKLQINKTVKLLQSGYIKMPVVIGHLKPVILIPLGLMASLPAEQLEAILLHELAHIHRNDYFINFLQNIAETVFFFNPALLWISSLLREERENCCDDMALAQTQNKKGFVQALISFREYELYGNNYATAFPGKKNYLMRRVSRILGNENKTFGFGEKIFFTGSIILLAFAVGTVAFGQVKDSVRKTAITAQHKTAHDSIPTDSVLAATDVIKAKSSLRNESARRHKKMRNGIVGIQRQMANLSPGESAELAKPITPRTEKPIAIAATEAVGASEKDTKLKQAISPKDEAARDRVEAIKDQLEAKKDQEQAIKDQADALKDQAQARIDQVQAEKDRKQALDDQAQALKNQEQVKKNAQQDANNQVQSRLNEIQSKKNQEQTARNNEQARLNEIQVKKNLEQDARNREQARLNEIQAKKNQEQAVKNQVSVQ